MWEIERGPDGLYDVLLNGRVKRVALDDDQVRMFFRHQGVSLEDVEGPKLS